MKLTEFFPKAYIGAVAGSWIVWVTISIFNQSKQIALLEQILHQVTK